LKKNSHPLLQSRLQSLSNLDALMKMHIKMKWEELHHSVWHECDPITNGYTQVFIDIFYGVELLCMQIIASKCHKCLSAPHKIFSKCKFLRFSIVNKNFLFLSLSRTRNRANGISKWITANSNAGPSATRTCDAADSRREWNATSCHPLNAAPTNAERCSGRAASHSWTLCELTLCKNLSVNFELIRHEKIFV
jgi:hypothetical protein